MFKKTVSGVVGKLTKIVNELEDVSVESLAEVEKQEGIIRGATQNQRASKVESDRALRIKNKINSLLS